jgi:hypothetical protein
MSSTSRLKKLKSHCREWKSGLGNKLTLDQPRGATLPPSCCQIWKVEQMFLRGTVFGHIVVNWSLERLCSLVCVRPFSFFQLVLKGYMCNPSRRPSILNITDVPCCTLLSRDDSYHTKFVTFPCETTKSAVIATLEVDDKIEDDCRSEWRKGHNCARRRRSLQHNVLCLMYTMPKLRRGNR